MVLGRMLLHACLLPLVVGVIAVWHVLLVRRRRVVSPINAARWIWRDFYRTRVTP